jgi:hypothetical protein
MPKHQFLAVSVGVESLLPGQPIWLYASNESASISDPVFVSRQAPRRKTALSGILSHQCGHRGGHCGAKALEARVLILVSLVRVFDIQEARWKR